MLGIRHVMLQVVIPAWYSDDISQEVEQLSMQVEHLVPADLNSDRISEARLLISKGAAKHVH